MTLYRMFRRWLPENLAKPTLGVGSSRLALCELEDRVTPTASLLRDINTTAGVGSNPDNFVDVNGTLYFTASTAANGNELWKSDGTAAGTVMVKDILAGSKGSNPTYLTEMNGNLFFSAFDGSSIGLWKSDGTAAGTVMVKASLNPRNMVNVNGTLFFAGSDAANGTELWKSDGTADGTVLVKNINVNAVSSSPDLLHNINGTLIFVASEQSSGREIWKSDGTAEGTLLLKDIQPGADSSGIGFMATIDGIYFFGAFGNELWKTDGTSAGTVRVKDVSSSATYLGSPAVHNGTLYFRAADSYTSHGYELWKSDGTVAGTVMVKDIVAGRVGSDPAGLASSGNSLYFRANDGVNGVELWKSDGTDSGTVLVKNINTSAGYSNPQNLTDFQGTLFFSATNGVNGTELWRSNGTADGTSMVVDASPSNGSSNPANMLAIGNKFFFTATTPANGTELWLFANSPPVGLALSNASVAENAANNVTIGTFSTTDPDAGETFTYTLALDAGDTDNGFFNINGNALRANASFDFETRNSYSVRIRSTDSFGVSFERTFSISVTNVNERPVITSYSGHSNVVLGTREGTTSVGQVIATDVDTAMTLTYSISSGADAAKFAIDAATGVLTFKVPPVYSNPTDSDANGIYQVTIRVSDGSLTDSQAFSVRVVRGNNAPAVNADVNSATEDTPLIVSNSGVLGNDADDNGSPMTASLVSGPAHGTLTLNADGSFNYTPDPDYSGPDSFTYIAADSTVLLTVNEFTGSNTAPRYLAEFTPGFVPTGVIPPPPIGTDGSEYELRDLVIGTDGSLYVYSGTFTPNLSTYNSTDGTWSQQSYPGWSMVNNGTYGGLARFGQYIYAADSITANEGMPSGIVRFDTAGGPTIRFASDISTHDIAVDRNGMIYAIVSGGTPNRHIVKYDPATLALEATMTIPFDDHRALAVSDDGSIYVATLDGEIKRFAPSGTLMNSLTVTGSRFSDIDIDPLGRIVLGTADGELVFTTTGLQSFTIQRVAISTVSVGGTVFAAWAPKNSQLATVTIDVSHVNDPPVITSYAGAPSVQRTVPENTTLVAMVTATDADLGTVLSYSISGGPDATLFSVDAVGSVVFNLSPNYETPRDADSDNVYEVTVEVSDGKEIRTQRFAITITDVNEAPTAIALSNNTVNRNFGSNTVVGSLSSTDPDTTPQNFSYTLVNGNGSSGNALFNILGNQLRVTNSLALASGTNYSIRVRSTDQGGASFEQTFTILSVPVYQAPPLIALSRSNGSNSNFIDWLNPNGVTLWTVPVPNGFGAANVTAVADRNNDGYADLILGSQAGLTNQVGLVSGKTGALLWSTTPFVSTFKGGVNVAAGDLDGDAQPEIIVAPASAGGPNVRAFKQTSIGSFAFTMVRDFYAYASSYTKGVNVAVADVNKDGLGDIITGTVSGSDNVRVFSAGQSTSMIADFFAFNRPGVIPGFAGGVTVAGGDLNNDGYADIITGTAGQQSRVRVYSGGVNAGLFNTPNVLLQDYTTSSSKLGVQVMAADFGDGKITAGTLTLNSASIVLNTYGYNNTLNPTSILTKTYARPTGSPLQLRFG